MKAWKRIALGLNTVLAIAAIATAPAAAIINGSQDTNNLFSNAGLIVLGDGTHWCSGVLYRTNSSQTSSNLFMTAAHCVLGYDFTGAKVTFDPLGDTNPYAQYISVVQKYSIPGYSGSANGNSLQNGNDNPDVAALVLDHAPAGITPADLPSAGLVDTLNFKTALIDAVGYGTTTATGKNFTYGARYYKTTGITPGQRTQSGDAYLKADASTCYGDSGGPNFLNGTDTILGDTSWGQSIICSDHNYIYRIDNSYALNFLTNPAATGLTN